MKPPLDGSRRTAPRIGRNLIALEGLDGTGKTRVGELLAARLGAAFAHTPNDVYEPLRDALHEHGGDAAFLFYLSSCAHIVAGRLDAPDAALVLDRFWFSSVVHHVWRANVALADVPRLVAWTTELLPVPAFTVLLSATRPARMRRIMRRADAGRGSLDPGFEACWAACARMADELLAPGTVLRIDTSDTDRLSAEDAAEMLARRIESERACRAWPA